MEENTVKPGLFEKGGKLGWLHSTWDAFDTFLRVPATVTAKGAHVRDAVDVKRIMIIVVLAVVPAALFGMWNVGYQHNLAVGDLPGFWNQFFWGLLKVLPLYLVSYIVGLGIEFASAQIKGEEVNEGYLVSGMLIPLIVPVDVPLWMLAIAVAFAVIFGKEVFGGTGMNFLNPALLCRAFLFFSYPSAMSGSEVWVYNSTYKCAYMTGFVSNQNRANEDWLISPQIDLTGKVSPALSFDHVVRYAGVPADEATVWVSENYTSGLPSTATWTKLPTAFTNAASWDFYNSGDISLSAYANKKIRIAIKYVSTATKAGTWEMKNFIVK